jgi:ribosomal protein S18 acetylase RimI-like enzyme
MSATAQEHVRRAVPGDAEQIAVIHVRSWQGAYLGLLPQPFLDGLDPAGRVAQWRQLLAEAEGPAAATLAGVRDGQVRGFAHFGPSRDAGAGHPPTGELYSIYVLPEAWGTGLGRELMAAACRGLAAAGYEQATLWVLAGNARARRFYDRAGWVPDGSQKQDEIAGLGVTEVRYRRPVA